MKRTKVNIQDGKVEFVKQGKGMLRLKNGKVVKSGERFFAYPEDIPEAFRDTIKPVDVEQQKTFEEHGVVESAVDNYSLKEVGGGWFDVVDAQDKTVNEKRLRKDDAEELVAQLNQKL